MLSDLKNKESCIIYMIRIINYNLAIPSIQTFLFNIRFNFSFLAHDQTSIRRYGIILVNHWNNSCESFSGIHPFLYFYTCMRMVLPQHIKQLGLISAGQMWSRFAPYSQVKPHICCMTSVG